MSTVWSQPLRLVDAEEHAQPGHVQESFHAWGYLGQSQLDTRAVELALHQDQGPQPGRIDERQAGKPELDKAQGALRQALDPAQQQPG